MLEYCWGKPLDGLTPTYDYVIACDCVYVERLVESLVWSMVQVSGRGTTLLVASEKREEVTYAKFRARLSEEFAVRLAPRRHMDKAYDHENSEVLLCKLRKTNTNTTTTTTGGSGAGGGGGGGSCSPAGNGAVVEEGTAAGTGTVGVKVEGGVHERGGNERAAEGGGVDSNAADGSAGSSAGSSAGAGAGMSLPEAGAPEGQPRRKATEHAADGADELSLAGVTLAAAPQGGVRRR